ncbi:hypothetical protein ACIQUS_14175 [Pseudomonas sp. NPDC090755]|uniref:hypothetical protein n=1 Tax=Pseudomonas sp. NPDC090755 TaxID=3364481 RepID=UPI00383BC24F
MKTHVSVDFFLHLVYFVMFLGVSSRRFRNKTQRVLWPKFNEHAADTLLGNLSDGIEGGQGVD